MQISCAFPTTLESPQHIKIAEDLGYSRAWLYDTPQQSPDIWMALALAAAKTERIGLGPGVLIPSLRHPMVNAAGTAGLLALAPGRVAVGFGTGFTGRRAMGYGSISWAALERYIAAYTALLRGETIEWEGARMRMLHPDGSAPARPIQVPIIISAFGPRGVEITHRLGHGLFGAAGAFPPPCSSGSAQSLTARCTLRTIRRSATVSRRRWGPVGRCTTTSRTSTAALKRCDRCPAAKRGWRR